MTVFETRLALPLAVAALAGGAVVATTFAEGRAPIQHEDVRPPPGAAERHAAAEAGLVGPAPAAGRNPSAFVSGDKLLPEPSSDPTPSSGEPVLGAGGFAADRDTQWSPDRATQQDGTLHYAEVFNPSVVPFKRMSVFDGVRPDFSLYARPSALTDLRVGGTNRSDRDHFWGSMLVSLQTGRDTAIPSVSPDMRILSYEAEPSIELAFSKDAADNYFVRTEAPGVNGTYRINVLVDADPGYFAPHPDGRTRIRDIPRSMVPVLPPETRESAGLAVHQLGLSPSMRIKDALDKMTYYFRSFEPRDEPPRGRNIFWDLFSSQAGVCRHRSFAFVVVALAAGIPARFVENEAHAFVEVWAPESGWMRIDLGGAALELDVTNAAAKSMYQPRGTDPFDKPPAYLENYSRLEGQIHGLSPAQRAEARTPRPAQSDLGDRNPLPAGAGQGGAGGNDGTGSGTGSGSGEPTGDARAALEEAGIPLPGSPDLGPDPAADDAPRPSARPCVVELAAESTTGYRGETVHVSGRVHGPGGAGISDLEVIVFLTRPGSDGSDAVWLGRTLTREDGTYSADVAVPGDIELGRYRVVAGTPGNDEVRAAISPIN